MTRSDRAHWTRLGRILARPFSSRTVGPEAFTNRSSATSPQATAGVCWWTRDGPFLEPPPGNISYQEKDSTHTSSSLSYYGIQTPTGKYNEFPLILLSDYFFFCQSANGYLISCKNNVDPICWYQHIWKHKQDCIF